MLQVHTSPESDPSVNHIRKNIRVMHVSSIEHHPCFSTLIDRQKAKYDVFFVKLDLIDRYSSCEIIEKPGFIRIKGIRKCFDLSYDMGLRDVFNALFLKYKPDIIHIHLFSGISVLPILNVASSFGIKKIITLHTHSLFCLRGTFHDGNARCKISAIDECYCDECKTFARYFELEVYHYNYLRYDRIRKIISQADKIISPSYDQKEIISRLFPETTNIVTKYYGVSLPPASFSRSRKRKSDKVITFGYLGTLSPLKGISSIEAAIYKLTGYNFRVLMGLTCDKRMDYDKQILKRLERNKNIIIEKNIIRSLLYKSFFSRIDYLIIPSIWDETGPMTLFEAFYYRIPVIVRNNPSLLEKIRMNKSSLVFGDAYELVKILKNILQGKIRKPEKDDFSYKSIDEYAGEIEKVYQEALASARRGLFLKLGYECNNNCIFCVTGDDYLRDFIDYKTISKVLETNRKKYNSLVFTGGEPTISRDFFKILELAYTLGYKILLQTNGSMVAKRIFQNKINKYHLEFTININGPVAKIHDATTRREGSFVEAVKATKYLSKTHQEVIAKVMLTKINYRYLADTVKFISKLGIKEIWIVFLTPHGHARTYFDAVVPCYTDVAPFVRKSIAWLVSQSKIKVAVEGFPYCCLSAEFHTMVAEGQFTADSLDGLHPGSFGYKYNCKYERAVRQKQKFSTCRRCKYFEKCEGVYREYIRHYGKDEITPVE